MFWTKKNTLNYIPKRVRDALAVNFNDHELEQLSRQGTLVDLAVGDKLAVEGTTGQQALIIVSGTATVLRDGTDVATLTAGDIVGEMALLSGQPRSATVVADTDMTVYALSSREFSSLLATCPRLERSITMTAVRRLAEAS